MTEAPDSELTQDTLVHDLNGVFETINEAAELIGSDRRWKSLADSLRRSVARGKRLVGALPDRTPDLASVVEGAIQSVTDYCIAARKPRLRLVHQIPAGIVLPGSAKDWERVFINLFINAAQILQRPGRIDIKAERTEAGLTISVADNGPGIPAELLPRLFRMRVSTKTNTKTRSGLGLQIVESIVSKYGGKISAANRERGTGAVFTIILPAS